MNSYSLYHESLRDYFKKNIDVNWESKVKELMNILQEEDSLMEIEFILDGRKIGTNTRRPSYFYPGKAEWVPCVSEPIQLSAGWHRIIVRVDSKNVVNETREWNNYRREWFIVRRNVTLDKKPDLIVYRFMKIRDNFVRYMIGNVGNKEVNNMFGVKVEVDGQEKCREIISRLGINERKTFTCNYNLTPGLHILKITVDFTNEVNETREWNNHIIRIFKVGAHPLHLFQYPHRIRLRGIVVGRAKGTRSESWGIKVTKGMGRYIGKDVCLGGYSWMKHELQPYEGKEIYLTASKICRSWRKGCCASLMPFCIPKNAIISWKIVT